MNGRIPNKVAIIFICSTEREKMPKPRETLKKIKKYTIIILQLIIIIFLFENLGLVYGTIGLVGIFGLLAVWRIHTNREMFMNTLRTIEGMIWGKPLNKELWNKGEMKKTKIKLVWGKKKNDN